MNLILLEDGRGHEVQLSAFGVVGGEVDKVSKKIPLFVSKLDKTSTITERRKSLFMSHNRIYRVALSLSEVIDFFSWKFI